MFEQVWKRIKEKTDISTFKELAEKIGTRPQYVSDKKRQDEFPLKWAFQIAQEYELNTDWIMTGKQSGFSDENNNKGVLYTEKEVEKLARQIVEKKSRYKNTIATTDPEINELLEKLSSWMVVLKKENPKRINWLECTLEDKIPEYKEWITARRLEEAEGLEQERKVE